MILPPHLHPKPARQSGTSPYLCHFGWQRDRCRCRRPTEVWTDLLPGDPAPRLGQRHPHPPPQRNL